jgi:hypothetical protein
MKCHQESIDYNQVGVECQEESVDLAGVNTLESRDHYSFDTWPRHLR